MRRVNPVISYITVLTFVLCFGLSLCSNIAHAYTHRISRDDLAPALSSVFPDNSIISQINCRRNQAEYHSFFSIVVIANHTLVKFGMESSFIDFIRADIPLSPWLMCARVSTPTRAAPISFSA